ncbi:Enoyl-[acyl-carrier-protein] reductase [FMN] [uncultured Rubrobacteraceae bacterium]|uniref:Probable nitronate monooxygenase n=1 Tax=uncultured Rubrobacteraceae bacterium TaxID=349277 RepID=A0A6J4Q4V7_9ACTN|nr:Enoyl-[acyl-carrier-protein] reductase [FMN] [uncultured Rubrobacteraceae bacterium]
MGLSTRVTELLRIEHPIVQAGMAGGATTPRLVAAVSEAGGLGTLGAAYIAPDAIRDAMAEVRSLTGRPFAVNLFVPEAFDPSLYDPREVNAPLARYREELGIEAPEEVGDFVQPFEDQLAVVLEERVPVFSFTFGIPEEAQISALKEAETVVVGTVTTVREGLVLEERGVDAVVGQGSEAGGHRGTFIGDFESALIGTMALVPQLADSLSVPVVAAGSIMDGRGLAAALVLGAEGVQMGTAFLPCPESGIHPKYKEAVLAAESEETALTRAFSGKPARGIRNRFLSEMGGEEVPEYPVQNAYTRDIRAAAAKEDRVELMSLWAGQAARLGRAVPAAEVVEGTAREAARRLSALTPQRS